MFIKPAFKNDFNISKGRGSGGLAIMWRKTLTKYVTNIKSDLYRVQAVKFNFPSADLLIVNLYLMVDPQVDQFDEIGLLNLLAEVNRIIQSSDCRNILLAGDLNCDFMRDTLFVNTVRQFVNDNNLCIFWSLPDESESHRIEEEKAIYSSPVNGVEYFSCIDHFLGNQGLYNVVSEAGVINRPDNHSGHSPIYTRMNVDQLNLEVEVPEKVPKHSWANANDEEKENFATIIWKT